MINNFSLYQKELIKKKFSTINSKEDILDVLNIANKIIYGEKALDYDLRFLTYYAYPDLAKKRYITFSIKKKSGKHRIINAPVKSLKSILKCFSLVLEILYSPNDNAMGFVRGRSIVDNAKLHLRKKYVYNIDLQNFFHSLDRNKVKLIFMSPPFNLRNTKEPIAFFLSSLFTHPIELNGDLKYVLPQGSPASPIISNLLCQALDRRLTGLAKRYGAVYSRYADDITFSSDKNIFKESDFQIELKRIIETNQKLFINNDKIRLQKKGYRQEVTGLTVNEKLNVSKKYIKEIRMWIYYIEKYGIKKAEEIFRKDYSREKGHIKKNNSPMINVIAGKLLFLKMVKGENDPTFFKLNQRFEATLKINDPINVILELWEKEGIEKAIELYYN